MARPNIGIDVDGVVMDFVSAFRKEAEAVFHKEFPPYNSDWDFADWGLTKRDNSTIWRRIIATPNWFQQKLEPLPNAVAGLVMLASMYEPYFVTTRVETEGLPVKMQTAKALVEKCYVDYPSVIVSKDKGPVAAALNLAAFVDDKVENLQRIEECSKATRIFLMDQVYNADFKMPESWTRVYSLLDFYNKLKGDNVSTIGPSRA